MSANGNGNLFGSKRFWALAIIGSFAFASFTACEDEKKDRAAERQAAYLEEMATEVGATEFCKTLVEDRNSIHQITFEEIDSEQILPTKWEIDVGFRYFNGYTEKWSSNSYHCITQYTSSGWMLMRH